MKAFRQPRNINQALSAFSGGDAMKAINICQDLLARNKKDAGAHALFGKILTFQTKYDLALVHLKKATSFAPQEKNFQALLAELYSASGSYSKALTTFSRLHRKHPDYTTALAGKANVLTKLKKWDEARKLLEPTIERASEDNMIAVIYARIVLHDKEAERALLVLQRHFDDPISPLSLQRMHTQAAKAHEQLKRFDEAFHHYALANQIARQVWDSEADSARHETIRRVVTEELIRGIPRPASPSKAPIFIVGMPRSGSTLVEQILVAHPDVEAVGEVFFMGQLVLDMGLTIGSTLTFPECLADLEQADVDTLATSYLKQLQALAPRADRICDKYLSNYEVVGLLAALFPDSPILHTQRHPMDTCLSCYFGQFTTAALAYTEDMATLGRRYVEYHRTMEHWSRFESINLLDVKYEELVADQENVTRRILEHCGLVWDERCLRFFEVNRSVLTMSREQVDRPIYTSSVGRHENYEKHFKPLRAMLEAEGIPLE